MIDLRLMETVMAELSVIIPVYQTEKYLERCITSILNQTFNDIEVILVDDGSTDQCPEMCDNYAEQDKRVRVIHKTNAGVAAARNSGLDAAEGEYITFVDSDDWIELDMYQNLMSVAHEYDCDVVMCDCLKDYGDHSEVYTHDIREGYYDYEQLQTEYYPHLLMMENIEYPPTISNWLCLFRRNSNSGLRYIEGVCFSEDLLYGAQMMLEAKSFYYLKGNTYYHYCMNPDSATHNFSSDKWTGYLKLHSAAQDYFLSRPEYNFQHQVDLMLLFFVYNAIGDIHRSVQVSHTGKMRMIKSILLQKDVREMFKRVSVNKLMIPWKLKLRTLFYKHGFGLV